MQNSRAAVERTGARIKGLLRAIAVGCELDPFEVLWGTSEFRKLI